MSLEHIDDLESLELSPALSERLGEYQDVLALCREAFPIEEPRADLLAYVIAEAHAVSRRVTAPTADGSGWRKFWSRWRGVLVPGFALAGTAAAVLLLLEPNRSLNGAAEQLSENQQIEERDSTPSEPANMARKDEPEPEPEPENEVEPPSVTPSEPSQPVVVPGSLAGSPSGVSKKKPRISKDAGAAVAPKPAPDPLSKDETWTTLERANADRRKGDCDRARSRYEEIIAASSDTLAVARAKAGIGLCLEQDRRTAEADQWFEQARSSSAGIDAWIENQRDEQPMPGETKKSKSKSMPADADAL